MRKASPQTIKRFLVMSVLFNILLMGGVLNQEALLKNGGKMPVLSDYQYSTSTHFSYQDKDEVERWYLTDRIKLPDGVWSPGDFLLTIPAFLMIGFGIYFVVLELKEGREIRNYEKNNS